MKPMKASLHCGVSSSKMSVKHNDRNFDLSRSKFIDQERTGNNIYWDCYRGQYTDADMRNKAGVLYHETFEKVEQIYYERTLERTYEKQRQRYYNKRQYAYANSMGPLHRWCRKQPKPQEIILQIGNMEEQPSADVFHVMFDDFISWLNAKYGKHFKILNIAEHYDEATPHGQLRGVWEYVQNDGTIKFSMTKAMQSAGIALPNPNLKEGVYEINKDGNPIGAAVKKTIKGETYYFNTRQRTFTEICRRKWIETAEAHGFEIINEPDCDAKHLSTPDYRIHQDTIKRNNRLKENEKLHKKKEADLQMQKENLEAKLQAIHELEQAFIALIVTVNNVKERERLEAQKVDFTKRFLSGASSIEELMGSVSGLQGGKDDEQFDG